MQSIAYFSIVLALATLALASSQPQQVDPVQASGNQASPVQVESVQVVPQQQQSPVVSVPVHPSQVGPESHGPQVGVEHQHHQVPVEHQHHQVGVEHQHHQVPVHHQQQQQFPSYYAPAGLIQVIGSEQQQQQPQGQVVGGNKPIVGRSSASPSSPVVAEQYGQPESAALPANYKPFGSWGLYIGGNPADGYYTNYYKQLSSSVEKQQQVGGAQQVSGEQTFKPTSALSPMLKQASGMSPFSGGDYYPFAYSMNDLSSATMPRSYVPQQQPQAPSMVVAAPQKPQLSLEEYCSHPFCGDFSPPMVTVGGHENGVSSYSGPVSYAPAPATKKFGSSYVQQKEQTKVAEYPAVVQQPAKGYNQPQYQQQQQQQYQQSRYFVYPQQVGPMSAPVAYRQVSVAAAAAAPAAPVHHQQQQVQHQQHQQVVAYPVPVGSQIVGSQAGVDGAFAPYGVHAFTRYAVKPTVVSGAEHNYHYGVSSQVMPAYKQQNQQMGYYYSSYPMNQLHHASQGGSVVPAVHEGEQSVYQHSPSSGVAVVGGSQFEASEKSETTSKSGTTTTTNNEDNKSQVNNKQQQQQQQKRA